MNTVIMVKSENYMHKLQVVTLVVVYNIQIIKFIFELWLTIIVYHGPTDKAHKILINYNVRGMFITLYSHT